MNNILENQSSSSLTKDQVAQIAKNREAALEKLRKRRLEEQGQQQEGPSSKPPFTFSQQSKVLNQNSTHHWSTKQKSSEEHGSKKKQVAFVKKEPLKFQLDSPSTFLISGGQNIGNILESINGYKFDPKEKTWRIPLTEYQSVLDKIPENDQPPMANRIPDKILDIFSSPNNAGFTSNNNQCEFDLKYLDAPIRNTLYPFQSEGIIKTLQRGGRIILADDMGLGKSIQAIAIACYYRLEWPLLIVTPASMVATWNEQLLRWLSASLDPEDVNVIYDGKQNVSKGSVIIVSYDLACRLSDVLKERNFKVIIADESHAFRNSTTKRAKFMVPLLKKANRAILLSGTPALSRPEELHTQIMAVQPKLFPKFFDYGMRYCEGYRDRFGFNWKGASNLKELQVVLENTVMIRRTKDQVLKELPRKIRQQVFLKVDPKDLKDLCKQTELATLNEAAQSGTLENLFQKAEYMAIWKRTGEIKLNSMIDYVEDLLDGRPQKMLLFAHHIAILDAFEQHFMEKKVRCIRIDGRTPTCERQELCSQFQREEGIRLALLRLTLTAASLVLFAELFWNPGVLVQAEDRAHRIGQTDCVTVQYLLARGTTDDRIWPLIVSKLKTLEEVGLCKNDFGDIAQIDHDPAQPTIDRFFAPLLSDKEDGGDDHNKEHF